MMTEHDQQVLHILHKFKLNLINNRGAVDMLNNLYSAKHQNDNADPDATMEDTAWPTSGNLK